MSAFSDKSAENNVILGEDGKIYVGRLFEVAAVFGRRLRAFWPLLMVIVFVLTVVVGTLYAIAPVSYTAVATIGPPNPTPMNAMMSGMGSFGNASAARRLFSSGGAGASNDPFQEYLQLLESPRLFVELSKDVDFLARIFPGKWDAERRAWRAPNSLYPFFAAIKRALHRPTTWHPDAIALSMYLKRNFSVTQADEVGSSAVASITRSGNGYYNVSLRARNPDLAASLLSDLLYRADEIVRQEQLRDVDARIAYIRSELENITQTDEKTALISVLTNQEQFKVMIVANKRFAQVLVSPPYASPVPTSPPAPTKVLFTVLLFSLGLWGCLVALEPGSNVVRKVIGRFRRPTVTKD